MKFRFKPYEGDIKEYVEPEGYTHTALLWGIEEMK